jgi:hypothetical protein
MPNFNPKTSKVGTEPAFQYIAKLIDFLKEIINSEYFINRHRQSPTDFVRQRKLPFSTLIFFLINFVKGSYQDELDHFFKAVYCLDVARNFVSWPPWQKPG